MTDTIVEALISRDPVIVHRRVRWGECDPAGVVYTPRFADYAVSAYEHFIACLLGDPPQARMHAMGLGLPMKAMTFEFRRSLPSEESFDMIVGVAAIRTRTFDLQIEGRNPEGDSLFVAVLSAICITPQNRTSIAIPAGLRRQLEEYQRQFPDAGVGGFSRTA
jgi:acyl-CoA thioester hydrolase